MTLTIQSRFPKRQLALLVLMAVDCRMIKRAPEAPMITPMDFFKVMGSFKMIAANNITATGVIAAMMEIFTGEVYKSAWAKESCAPTKPNSDPKKMMKKSRGAIFSFGKKQLTLQKISVANAIRTKVKAYGLIHAGTKLLAMGVLSPKIQLVAMIARCPRHFSLVIIFFEGYMVLVYYNYFSF